MLTVFVFVEPWFCGEAPPVQSSMQQQAMGPISLFLIVGIEMQAQQSVVYIASQAGVTQWCM